MAERHQHFLTPAKLSKRWGGEVAVKTLANWRSLKRGPRWVKFEGRVLYPIGDIVEYEMAGRPHPGSQ